MKQSHLHELLSFGHTTLSVALSIAVCIKTGDIKTLAQMGQLYAQSAKVHHDEAGRLKQVNE